MLVTVSELLLPILMVLVCMFVSNSSDNCCCSCSWCDCKVCCCKDDSDCCGGDDDDANEFIVELLVNVVFWGGEWEFVAVIVNCFDGPFFSVILLSADVKNA